MLDILLIALYSIAAFVASVPLTYVISQMTQPDPVCHGEVKTKPEIVWNYRKNCIDNCDEGCWRKDDDLSEERCHGENKNRHNIRRSQTACSLHHVDECWRTDRREPTYRDACSGLVFSSVWPLALLALIPFITLNITKRYTRPQLMSAYQVREIEKTLKLNGIQL